MNALRPMPKVVIWSLVVGVLLVATVVALRILGAAATGRVGRVGDGHDPATYGFDLDGPTLSASVLAASSRPRDGLTSLDRPPLLTVAGVDSLNSAERGKYLVPTDLVIGVVRDGEARAWPLRVLDWHGTANDTLGGRPVLVTWCPLAGAARVFDPAVGDDALHFGVSGLIGGSNTLLYAAGDTLSLWSQLSGRAVTGPAETTGLALRDLPAVVCDWAHWRTRYPQTTVPLPAKQYRKRYKSDPYFSYRHGQRLRFPVADEPPADPLAPQLIVQLPDASLVVDVEAVAAHVGPGGVWTLDHRQHTLRLKVGGTLGVETPPVWLEGAEQRPDIRSFPIYTFARAALPVVGEEVRP